MPESSEMKNAKEWSVKDWEEQLLDGATHDDYVVGDILEKNYKAFLKGIDESVRKDRLINRGNERQIKIAEEEGERLRANCERAYFSIRESYTVEEALTLSAQPGFPDLPLVSGVRSKIVRAEVKKSLGWFPIPALKGDSFQSIASRFGAFVGFLFISVTVVQAIAYAIGWIFVFSLLMLFGTDVTTARVSLVLVSFVIFYVFAIAIYLAFLKICYSLYVSKQVESEVKKRKESTEKNRERIADAYIKELKKIEGEAERIVNQEQERMIENKLKGVLASEPDESISQVFTHEKLIVPPSPQYINTVDLDMFGRGVHQDRFKDSVAYYFGGFYKGFNKWEKDFGDAASFSHYLSKSTLGVVFVYLNILFLLFFIAFWAVRLLKWAFSIQDLPPFLTQLSVIAFLASIGYILYIWQSVKFANDYDRAFDAAIALGKEERADSECIYNIWREAKKIIENVNTMLEAYEKQK